MRMQQSLPLVNSPCKMGKDTANGKATRTVVKETINRAPFSEVVEATQGNKNNKRKRQTSRSLSPMKKAPRLSILCNKEGRISTTNMDSIIALIGDDPPKSWPDTARRMWSYCRVRCPTLLSDLVIGATLAQQRPIRGSKSTCCVGPEHDAVSALMGYLVQSWGAAVLTRVCRHIMTSVEGRSELAVDEKDTRCRGGKGGEESSRHVVDLTLDDDEEQSVKRTLPDKKAIHRDIQKNVSTHKSGPAALNAVKDTTTLPWSDKQPVLCPGPHAAPDVLQLAVAYGFDLARRYGTTTVPAIPLLWKEAARTVRFMSPWDRQRMWKYLSRKNSKEKAACQY